MTPKEKALQLVEAYWEKIVHDDDGDRHDMCKQCALIAVNEIINESLEFNQQSSWDERDLYWQEVRREIEKYD